MNNSNQSREEFEKRAKKDLNSAIEKARQMRAKLRSLEAQIASHEKAINKKSNTLADLQTQLVKLQAEVYAKGTT